MSEYRKWLLEQIEYHGTFITLNKVEATSRQAQRVAFKSALDEYDLWLAEAPVVYGRILEEGKSFITLTERHVPSFYSHIARLVCIEELEK